MFNFFSEIKRNIKNIDLSGGYNLINMSGKVLYIEGHLGLTLITKKEVCLKIKNGRLLVEGEDLVLSELSENTVKISGKIIKTEAF